MGADTTPDLRLAGDSLMAAARSLAYAWETDSPDRVMWDKWKKVQPATQAWVDARRSEVDEPAAVDWPARFRAAADEAERNGWDATAHVFGALGVKAKFYPDEVEGIGRALNGETTETETAAELAGRDGDTDV